MRRAELVMAVFSRSLMWKSAELPIGSLTVMIAGIDVVGIHVVVPLFRSSTCGSWAGIRGR